MEIILDLEQFKEIKKKSDEFVAITDKNLSRNCVHHVSCQDVTENYFIQKVIKNKRKNGDYFHTKSLNEALGFNNKMVKCQKCLS